MGFPGSSTILLSAEAHTYAKSLCSSLERWASLSIWELVELSEIRLLVQPGAK